MRIFKKKEKEKKNNNNNNHSLEKIENGLARARAAIRAAARRQSYKLEGDEIFIPRGPVYRNPYAFHQLSFHNLIRIYNPKIIIISTYRIIIILATSPEFLYTSLI